MVGLSRVPKGEFSSGIAARAAAAAGGHSDIEALTGIYVLALSLLGPVGMREADRIWEALAQRLPSARRASRRLESPQLTGEPRAATIGTTRVDRANARESARGGDDRGRG